MSTDSSSPEASGEQDYLDQLPDDNPFSEVVRERREAGKSFDDLFWEVEEVQSVLDDAAMDEKTVEQPVYEVKVVVPDESSTSGESYATERVEGPDIDTPEDAKDEAEDYPHVIRAENAEQVDTAEIAE